MKKREDTMVLAAVHCGGGLSPEFTRVLLSLVATQKCKLGVGIVPGEPIHESLNKLVDIGLQSNFDYICIMDADTTNAQADIIERLLVWEKDIVGAFSYNRAFPYMPNVFNLPKTPPDVKLWDIDPVTHEAPLGFAVGAGQGLQPVDLVSTQMLMVKADVFRAIPWPWFSFEKNCLPDAYFCQKAKDHGFQVWCDTNYIAEHNGMNPLKREYMIRYEGALRRIDVTQYLATSPLQQHPLYSQTEFVRKDVPDIPDITPFKTVQWAETPIELEVK